ncbi:MAG: oligosaccharide flippase family protein [Chitinophagaceae bacterium]
MDFWAVPVTTLKNFINKGHSRSIRAKKNIIASFFIKGLSIAISLIVLPLTINYINPSRYGIWLTLSSIVGWFSFFDIGLSHGLRNKYAEAKATGNDELAQVYVSTTYAILTIIFSVVWLIFLLANHFVNWSNLLNISQTMQGEVSTLAVIIFTYFCLNFVLVIVSTLILADQQPAKSSSIGIVGQVISLIFILILVKTTQGSLIKLGIALCVSPILVLIGANFYFFRGVLKKFRPRMSKINFSHAKALFNLGIMFFVIQIAGLIQFETANFIIARNFGTVEVTAYNIVHKYFGILSMLFGIFLNPFWSASTEAYLKKDINWIKNGIKKYNQLNILLLALSIIMLIFSDNIYSLWLGKGKLNIAFSISLWGCIFVNVSMFCSKYVYFLNSISALRIQFLASIISPIIYIIAALTLIKYFHFGVFALFVASIIANFNGLLLAPLQYFQIIYKNRKGIWVK